jgi:hypothetical protein
LFVCLGQSVRDLRVGAPEVERAANRARKARVAAAKKVDAAMATLGRAYEELLALDTCGDLDGANRAHVIRRKRYSARARSRSTRRRSRACSKCLSFRNAHRRSLAEIESGLIQEFATEPDPEAEPA